MLQHTDPARMAREPFDGPQGANGTVRLQALQTLEALARPFPQGHVFTHYLDCDPMVTVLFRGVAARVRNTSDGRRRIVGLLFAGEASGSTGLISSRANYELCALNDCVATQLRGPELRRVEARQPAVRSFLVASTQQQLETLQDMLVDGTGRRVEERLHALLQDMYRRLRRTGAAEDGCMEVPLRQIDLADMLGVSTVQMSRAFAQLRSRGVHCLRRGAVMQVCFGCERCDIPTDGDIAFPDRAMLDHAQRG